MKERKIKAISIDLDGTLLNSKSRVSNKNRDAIQNCMDENIKIIISSAKTAGYIRALMEDLSLRDPQICSGGAIIIDKGPKPLYELKICPSYARQIIEYARDFQEGTTIACSNASLYYENWQNSLEHILKSGEKLVYTEDLTAKEILENALMFSITIEQNSHLEIFLKKKFNSRLQITRGGKFFLTILNEQASKANALKSILSMFNLASENVMAIGDSQNDMETLQYAGTSIAMGNAIEELKKIADHIVKDHDHDGVADAIYDYVLA